MAVLAQDLRDAVLQAALEGKLTTQSEDDSSVDDLIESIKADRTRIANRKKARNDKLKGIIEDDELLINHPEKWGRLRLGEIGVYKKGPFGSALTKSIFVPRSEDTIKVYEQKNAIHKDESLGEYYITRQYYDEHMKGFTVEPGDIIVSCAGTIGESYVLPEEIELGIINQALMRMTIVPAININYFLLYFDFILKNEAKGKSKGGAIKNIPPFDILKNLPVPLPPLEEQQRIVDKVEELMAAIDEYEALENELEELKKNFPQEMKESLLQAAMEGNLTNCDNIPMKQVWEVTAWDKKFKEVEKSKQSKVCKYTYLLASELEALEVPNGDILLLSTGNYVGYTTEDRAKNVIAEGEVVSIPWGGFPNVKYTKGKFVTSDNRIATSLDTSILSNKYFYYWMLSQMDFLKKIYRGTSLKHPEMKAILNQNIPVPPIEEQEKIIEAVESYLPLCDELSELA